jgi:hypothetical protein
VIGNKRRGPHKERERIWQKDRELRDMRIIDLDLGKEKQITNLSSFYREMCSSLGHLDLPYSQNSL